MFEKEADKYMVEALLGKGKIKNIGLLELYVFKALLSISLSCLLKRFRRDVYAQELRRRAVGC